MNAQEFEKSTLQWPVYTINKKDILRKIAILTSVCLVFLLFAVTAKQLYLMVSYSAIAAGIIYLVGKNILKITTKIPCNVEVDKAHSTITVCEEYSRENIEIDIRAIRSLDMTARFVRIGKNTRHMPDILLCEVALGEDERAVIQADVKDLSWKDAIEIKNVIERINKNVIYYPGFPKLIKTEK